MKLIAGIDEAGRGSVIGPMVIAGTVFKEEDIEKLVEINVRDSKELKPHSRKMLLEKILELACSWKLVLVSAKEIDSETRRSGGEGITNLEAKIFAEILNNLKPDIAYIDLPSINVEKFREKLTMNLTHSCVLILEHEADKKYPVTA
ncbi:MAG: ribonuclease HII, partial [Nitrososphaerota archaeon]